MNPVSFFTRFFRRRNPGVSFFTVRASDRTLPELVVRSYQPTDFAACVRLYQENEPGRFPLGVLEDYAEFLRQQRALVLIVEQGGKVVGSAGIHSDYQNELLCYWLTYGLVNPKFHRQGIGTVLLLTRIALLPAPARAWLLGMTCVESSHSFYERFGFRNVYRAPDRLPLVAGTFMALVKHRQILRARKYLRRRGIVLDSDMYSIPLQVSQEDSAP